MDMLLHLKLKAAAREQNSKILQAGNINLGGHTTIPESPVPEMTELIHSSNLDSASRDASNVPLELISEMTEVKYQSSSDNEAFDEDDDEEVTPTIMPLPITRESSKKMQNSSEDLDILSLIAGSKNGDDFIPKIITPESSRSRRAS